MLDKIAVHIYAANLPAYQTVLLLLGSTNHRHFDNSAAHGKQQ